MEQEQIINQFLDVIKVKDYITNSKLERKNCKCNDYKKHHKYCVLDELPIPEIVANKIYGFAHRCIRCANNIDVEEKLERLVVFEGFYQYHPEKYIFSLKRTFPSFETVQSIIKGASQKKYKMLKELFDNVMYHRSEDYIQNRIPRYWSKWRARDDFNKIMDVHFNKPDFDLFDHEP